MQIFWPEKSYTLSARALDDKRLNKQIIELGQILSTAIWIEDCGTAETLYSINKIYLPTHENHPVIKNCKHYYKEALTYMDALMLEYSWRFTKIHNNYMMFLSLWVRKEIFNKYRQTPFQNHTTNHKHIQDINLAYQQCLIEKWSSNSPKWTNRPQPAFFTNVAMVHEN